MQLRNSLAARERVILLKKCSLGMKDGGKVLMGYLRAAVVEVSVCQCNSIP